MGWSYLWPALLSCSIAAIKVSLSKPPPSCLPGICLASPSCMCCAEKGLITSLLDPPTSLLLPEQSYLSPLHVLTTLHPLWDNRGGHFSTNLAPLLPCFTSFPWHPFPHCHSRLFTSFLNLPCLPVSPGFCSSSDHCGQEILGLIGMFENLEKQFTASKVQKEDCSEANQHLIPCL